MAYVMGQATVPSSSTVPVLTVPPGFATVTFYASTAATLYLGTTTRVSPASGAQVSVIPTALQQFVSSSGATYFAANTSATTSGVFNYCMTTGQ